jgi:hypothetical protein
MQVLRDLPDPVESGERRASSVICVWHVRGVAQLKKLGIFQNFDFSPASRQGGSDCEQGDLSPQTVPGRSRDGGSLTDPEDELHAGL